MKRRLLKNSSVLFVVILFTLMTGVALAEKQHWFVVKDKGGVCRVIEAQAVAGPFKTMGEAEKRKAKDCPKGTGQTTEQLRSPQEQAEPMRRQHQQREEAQQQHLKQPQAPHQQQQQAPHEQQQTEKLKEKAHEKIEGAKSSGEKVKEKLKEPIPTDKKN
jgi:membrane protein involved in colicin uptake